VDLTLVVGDEQALPRRLAVELHGGGVELLGRDPHELVGVVVLVEVRAVDAAAEHGVVALGVDAGTPRPVDARVVRQQERHVERVAQVVVVGVVDRDPLTGERHGSLGGAANRGA
jgi:hypothetical protein